jgi:DNA-binding response OmpR family regulator
VSGTIRFFCAFGIKQMNKFGTPNIKNKNGMDARWSVDKLPAAGITESLSGRVALLSVPDPKDYNTRMPKTVLMVDDNLSVRDLVSDYLSQQGYRVVTARDGKEALFTARRENPDVILLDIMMPEMDGYEFLRQFRRERGTPVIILTARVEESDAVLGLELGADDYVVKPFRMRELAARIQSVLRRSDPGDPRHKRLHLGDVELDEITHSVEVNGRTANLTPTEFNLLSILMHAPGQVYTREQLVDRLSQSGFSGLEQTLNVHVRNLRLKIEPDPENPRYVEAVFGVGYRFAKPRS